MASINSNSSEESHGVKRYQINRVSFTGHYDVETEDGAPLYYVDKSSIVSPKPDLMIYHGDDKKGPMLGASKIPLISRHFKVGLGDPELAVQWEDMKKENLLASEHSWSMIVPTGGGARQRRNFTWKRTHNVGVDGGDPSAFSGRNFKLLDPGTDDLLAVFTSDRTLTKCGLLQINVAYGEGFDQMVILTLLSMYDKARRRKNRRALQATGGLPGP